MYYYYNNIKYIHFITKHDIAFRLFCRKNKIFYIKYVNNMTSYEKGIRAFREILETSN